MTQNAQPYQLFEFSRLIRNQNKERFYSFNLKFCKNQLLFYIILTGVILWIFVFGYYNTKYFCIKNSIMLNEALATYRNGLMKK